MHSQSFTDAQGWNLTENYGTLQTAAATLTENDGSHARTLILGRGNKGLEVYKFTGGWTAAAESNFPQYCTNFNTDKVRSVWPIWRSVTGPSRVKRISDRSTPRSVLTRATG